MGHPITIPVGAVALLIAGLLGFPVFIPVFVGWAWLQEWIAIPFWVDSIVLWSSALIGIYVNCMILHWFFRKIKPKPPKS
jgi:hypothetical protein